MILFSYHVNFVNIQRSINEYFIDTFKYQIDWYANGNLYIYDVGKKSNILNMQLKFDMSLFAKLSEDGTKIVYSSAEIVNSQVERLLKLKAFS
jgi:hypothetical protein